MLSVESGLDMGMTKSSHKVLINSFDLVLVTAVFGS